MLTAIEAHHHWEKGQGREFWGDDPEWWLLQAVAHYDRVLEAIRADDARNNAPTGAGPPPGADVQGPEVSVRG